MNYLFIILAIALVGCFVGQQVNQRKKNKDKKKFVAAARTAALAVRPLA